MFELPLHSSVVAVMAGRDPPIFIAEDVVPVPNLPEDCAAVFKSEVSAQEAPFHNSVLATTAPGDGV